MSNEKIQIFYACDNNFVKYAIVSIKSLISNVSKNNSYAINVLHTDVSPEMQKIAKDMETDNVEINFIDVTHYLRTISDKLPIRDYYSKTTYYRLFIAEMFPQIKKALYLDCDMIILNDVAKLYNSWLGDNYVASTNEQVMVQTPVFGEYVEKVLGIGRYNYFNAGLLLINCDKFRENGVLDQFINLLHTYSFVVTQDEDYLNIICEDKVKFLDPSWNVQTYGKILCDEKNFNIIHYIMVSKPWHYKNAMFANYFWDYAKQTAVYEKLLEELENYTDEQRARDQVSSDRLFQTAIKEINREDNYLNMLTVNSKRAPDRVEILKKIDALERDGKFDQDVENDPPARELKPNEVDYLRKKVSEKVKASFAFFLAKRFLKKILRKKQMIVKDIQGIDNIKNLKSGAIITCNHFNPFDSFAIQMVYERSNQKRKFFRVIKEGNYTSFPGFYGFLMRNCNTLPLSNNFETMKEFIKSTNTLLRDGHFVLVYPEQSLWWNYRKPKPLKKGAFNFASKNNVPVLPCFITMKDSKIMGEDGFYVQEYTIHVSKPIYPDPTKSPSQNSEELMNKNYEEWKRIYEKTYKRPLQYLCDEKNSESIDKAD